LKKDLLKKEKFAEKFAEKFVLKAFAARVFVYTLGLFLIAFGVVFSVNSKLGVSPVSSLPYAVHLASGVEMGVCVTLFMLLCVVLQIAILRKNFKPHNLAQFIFAFVFGYFVRLAQFIKGDFTLETYASYAGQLMMLAISLLLIASGIVLHLEARLVSIPPEGLALAIASKLKNGKYHKVKVWMDCTFVVLSVAIMLLFLARIPGVREGTIITAVFVGKLIPPVKKVCTGILGKAGFYRR
jgi:uncharacterized membrane protein YczE